MSGRAGALGGPLGLSRREMLGAVARWSVPTIVTITLGARVLEAKASCPPCTKKSAGKCKACTVSQILNCNCEPCLGAPYCSAAASAAASPSVAPGSRGLGEGYRAPGGSAPGYGGAPGSGNIDPRLAPLLRRYQQRSPDPFNRPLYKDPFGVDRRTPGERGTTPGGLYERLRGTTPDRRRF